MLPSQGAVADEAIVGQVELGQTRQLIEAPVFDGLNPIVVQLQPLQLLEARKDAFRDRFETVSRQVELETMLKSFSVVVTDVGTK
jgi:hypothetical protein